MKKIAVGGRRGVACAITFAIGVGSIGLAGCCSPLPKSTAIDASEIGKVQQEIKRQVGDYLVYAHKVRAASAAAKGTGVACGGSIDFQIDTVLLDLQTTLTDKTAGNLGIKIPVGASGVSIGPKFDGSRKTVNTQQIQFHEYPVPDGYYADFLKSNMFAVAGSENSISTLLIALHQGLLSARTSAPCLSGIDYTTSEQKGSTNTYIIGLDFTGSGTPGVDVTVGPVTLSASHEHTVENDNKLTVTFRQVDLDAVPEFKTVSKKPFNPKLFAANHTLNDELFGKDRKVKVAAGSRDDDPPTQPEAQAFTLCRDAEYFTYWCTNKTEKVEFSSH